MLQQEHQHVVSNHQAAPSNLGRIEVDLMLCLCKSWCSITKGVLLVQTARGPVHVLTAHPGHSGAGKASTGAGHGAE